MRTYQKLLPDEIGIIVMKAFSDVNRVISGDSTTTLSAHAKLCLESDWADVVVCGHDHQVRKETFEDGEYYNTGAFFNDKSMLLYSDDTFQLVKWKSSDQTFVPYSEFDGQ